MEIIEQLLTTKQQTLTYFQLSESTIDSTYAEGKWTVREILHHLADAETVLYERIRRTIARPNQVLWAFDQDAWCRELDYRNFPPAISRAIYESTRDAVIFLAKKYYGPLGSNQFVHNENGIRTLREEFDKVAWHNQGHLDQIERALEKKVTKEGAAKVL